MGIIVSASVLSADFGKLADALQLCESSGVGRIHVDAMDGHFVPNITIGPVIVAAVRRYTKLPIAAHLMIEHPQDYIDAFIDAGADIVSVHAECYGERRKACLLYGQYPKEIDHIDQAGGLADTLARIRARGAKACVTVNPGTPVECLAPVIGLSDAVLVMSVNPGFSGQKFMPSALSKIAWLRAQGFPGDIAVDGGINAATAPLVVQAGANVLVTASYFFSSKDPVETVSSLKRLKAQAMLEYLLIVVVVAVIVFGAFSARKGGLVSKTHNTASHYFDTGAAAIMGGYYERDGGRERFVEINPQPVDGGWCRQADGSTGECACPRPAFGGAACP